jgi:multimeric flavodoxin WrbA
MTTKMATKVHVIFYSMYGHVYRMAEAVAAGARELSGTEVTLFQVPELVSDEILEKSGAKAARQLFAHVPPARVPAIRRMNSLTSSIQPAAAPANPA